MLTAKLVPYSSVVGQSVAMHDESGAVVALAMISVPSPSLDYRSTAEPIARLIAAAPETAADRDRLREVNAELVAALRSLLDQLEPKIGMYATIAAARAAIAKAEGRSDG